MSDIPAHLNYTEEHEWVHVHEDDTATIGITLHAQDSLGDITFVELPEVGAAMGKGDVFGVVESVKAASDLYMPVSGEILEVNEDLEGEPEVINLDPYAKGWIIKVKVADTSGLLSAEEYQAIVG